MTPSDMQSVIHSYENYKEDFRLQSNNSHRLEYLTTIAYMDKYIGPGMKILDVAAGTGAYALHYAETDCEVTALDITPSYIDLLKQKAEKRGLKVTSFPNDARDLSMFEECSFNAVFCMGPIYHLTEAADREKVLNECYRVLKPEGLLFLAYINKYFVFSQFALNSRQYLQEKFFQKVVIDQTNRSTDPDNFWTDAWFTTPGEMEALAAAHRFAKIKHIAQDGVGRLKSNDVDAMPPEAFEKWAGFHLRMCEEPSILGISNHGLLIAMKK